MPQVGDRGIVSPSWVQCQDLFWVQSLLYATNMAVVKRSKPHKAEYEAFLKRLVQAREEAGLNQSQAAERLGKPRSFVSKCELGERRVDLVECKMFATLYGKDMSFFCGD